MDNASKALIIAGAVLIAVMLVSLGVLIYNQANQIVQEQSVQMQGLSVSGFNNLFSVYYGTNKNSATVKSLVEQASSTNRTSEDHEVTVTGDGVTNTNLKNITFTPIKNKTYKIEASEYDANGFVTKITVTAQ